MPKLQTFLFFIAVLVVTMLILHLMCWDVWHTIQWNSNFIFVSWVYTQQHRANNGATHRTRRRFCRNEETEPAFFLVLSASKKKLMMLTMIKQNDGETKRVNENLKMCVYNTRMKRSILLKCKIWKFHFLICVHNKKKERRRENTTYTRTTNQGNETKKIGGHAWQQ